MRKNKKDFSVEVRANSDDVNRRYLSELWDKLLQKPSYELEDYNDWIDELSPGELKNYLNDSDFRAWLEKWDKPRFERLNEIAA